MNALRPGSTQQLAFLTGAAGVALGIWALVSGQTAGVIASVGLVGFCWLAYQAANEKEQQLTQTARRQEFYEKQLRYQREVVDALADGLDVGILLTDAKGIIEYCNRAASTMFRFQEPAGKSIVAVSLSQELGGMVEDVALRGRRTEGEIQLRLPEERVVIAQVWQDPRTEDRVFITLYDISRLKRLETVRKDFVANVSHELRTPLTTIRGFAETLLDSPQNELLDLKDRYLNKIISEADRLTLIAQDLLTLSLAESTEAPKETLDLCKLVAGVIPDLDRKAKDKELMLAFEESGPAKVLGNENQLIQVALNVIDNAIKYTNEGTIKVNVGCEGTDAVLEVTDSGIGIPEHDRDRIFERFYRVDKGRSRSSGGTGLGLSIVKHITEAHGGRVEVSSELHLGTTFRVFIPLAG